MLRKLKKWLVRDEATVAVEFAMIAIPFFTLLLGTVEVGLFYASAVVLEGGAQSAARLVRTGQAQTSGDAETAFKDKLCDMVGSLIPCASILYESIKIPDGTFATASNTPAQYAANGNMLPQGFAAGGPSDVILMRVSYRYTFFIPLVGSMLDKSGGNASTLTSTVVVKNEPYKVGI